MDSLLTTNGECYRAGDAASNKRSMKPHSGCHGLVFQAVFSVDWRRHGLEYQTVAPGR